ncbi:MAG TPA: polyprenyl synthetase family protein [Gammaproteobacteria bacterium]|nr:polyprenyl synthetase family protein [Gammaproteobacteria bacterium]
MTILNSYQHRINTLLLSYIHKQKSPPPLQEALAYCIGGKHIRALIIYTLGHDLNIPTTTLDSIAISVELMHSFTLIHDDLPCMDNDDFRRNKPSCHRKFNEAIAVLAGDALQALSYEALSQTPGCTMEMVQTLSKATGAKGLCGGQTLDCLNHAQSADDYLEIISMKTAELIATCFKLTALIARLDNQKVQQLTLAGKHLGIAFQLQDDIQDHDQDHHSILQFISLDTAQQWIHHHFQETLHNITTSLKNHPSFYDLFTFIKNRELA